MIKNGVVLAFLVFLSAFGFSGAAEAHGFFDLIFGHDSAPAASQVYFAPSSKSTHRHSAHSARHHDRRYAQHWRKHRRDHSKLAAHHRNLLKQAVVAALTNQDSPPVARPCCGNASEAINQIIKNDPTLRPGDAYMSNDGLKIYVGEGGKSDSFVSIDKARHIGSGLKNRLAEMTRRPGAATKTPGAAEAKVKHAPPETKLVAANDKHAPKEKLVHGPNGRLIRLVGGFVN